jgi:hypothetical protein
MNIDSHGSSHPFKRMPRHISMHSREGNVSDTGDIVIPCSKSDFIHASSMGFAAQAAFRSADPISQTFSYKVGICASDRCTYRLSETVDETRARREIHFLPYLRNRIRRNCVGYRDSSSGQIRACASSLRKRHDESVQTYGPSSSLICAATRA